GQPLDGRARSADAEIDEAVAIEITRRHGEGRTALFQGRYGRVTQLPEELGQSLGRHGKIRCHCTLLFDISFIAFDLLQPVTGRAGPGSFVAAPAPHRRPRWRRPTRDSDRAPP